MGAEKSALAQKNAKKNRFFYKKTIEKSAGTGYILDVVDTSGREGRRKMSTQNDNVILNAAATGCVDLSCSFSVSRSVLQDAEKQTAGAYSVASRTGRSFADFVCVVLDGPSLSAVDLIRVGGAVCTLYRVVAEKIAGFAAVVRRSWTFSKHRVKTHFRSFPARCERCFAARNVILSFAGGLRL